MDGKSALYYCGDSMGFVAKSLEYDFPKPIQKVEIYSLIKLAQDGNVDAQNAIVASNYKWIYKIAKSLQRPTSDVDDLFQVGIVACIKAIHTFDLQTDIAFLTYATMVISNEIKIYLSKIDSHLKHVTMSTDEPIGNNAEGDEIYLIDSIADNDIQKSPEEYYDMNLMRDIILERISHLNKRERELLEIRFGLNDREKMTLQEAAKYFGFSKSYICRLLRATLDLLKDELYYLLN